MIEHDRADRREMTQVVFVGRVISVPRDDVERRLADLGAVEFAAPFDEEPRGLFPVLVGGDRGEKISRIGETIGADGTAIRQRERAAVVFAHESARRAVQQFDPEDHAARNDADFARFDIDDAEFGAEPKGILLRDDEIFAVGIEEIRIRSWMR